MQGSLGFSALRSLVPEEPKPVPVKQAEPMSIDAVVKLYNSPENAMNMNKPESMKTQADKQAIIQKTIELAKEQEEK